MRFFQVLIIVFLLLPTYLHVAYAQPINLLRNGGFEEGLASWSWSTNNPTLPGDRLLSVEGIVRYRGMNALRITAPASLAFETVTEVRQGVQGLDHPIAGSLSFFVHPEAVRETSPLAHLWLYLLLDTTSPQGKQSFTLAYHVAWEGAPLFQLYPVLRDWKANTSMTTDFFLNLKLGEWAHVQRDLRRDFESRFGPSGHRVLTGVEVRLSATSKQPTCYAQACITPQDTSAWWDDVSLEILRPPKTMISQLPSQPLQLKLNETTNIDVVIENAGDLPLLDVKAALVPDAGLRIAQAPQEQAIGQIDPQRRKTVSWVVVASVPGDWNLKVVATSRNGGATEKTLKTIVVSETRLELTVKSTPVSRLAPIEISARLSDEAGRPIGGQKVDFFIRGDRELKIESLPTDARGEARASYMPQETGSYSVKAAYQGGGYYRPSAAEVTDISAGLDILTLLPGAIAAALISMLLIRWSRDKPGEQVAD